jgi:hypothetical protein
MALLGIYAALLIAIAIVSAFLVVRDARRTPDPLSLEDMLRMAEDELLAERGSW